MQTRSRACRVTYSIQRPYVPGVVETFTHALTTLLGLGLLVALAGVLLGGCADEDIESLLVSNGPAGASGPQVVAISPQDGATAVTQSATIAVTFSEPMNAAATASAIAVVPAVGGFGAWSADGTTYTLTPSPALTESTTYAVSVDVLATSQGGRPLMAGAAASFTVEDLTPPLFDASTPEHTSPDVSTTSAIKLVFTEAMDPASTIAAFAIAPSVAGTFNFDSGPEVLSFIPAAPLAPATTYQVTVDTSAKDLAGNPLYAPVTIRFDTAP